MKRVAILSAAIALVAGPALAHTGAAQHSHLLDGLVHPFAGLDHLLAMLGVGIWAFQSGERVWVLPAAFTGAMLVGGIGGLAGIAVPYVETGIAGSVLLLGFLIALAPRLPVALSLGLVGSFALLHGYAHGIEAPQAASPLPYILGFAIATALMHGAGIALAAMAGRVAGAPSLRALGLAIGAAGLFLASV